MQHNVYDSCTKDIWNGVGRLEPNCCRLSATLFVFLVYLQSRPSWNKSTLTNASHRSASTVRLWWVAWILTLTLTFIASHHCSATPVNLASFPLFLHVIFRHVPGGMSGEECCATWWDLSSSILSTPDVSSSRAGWFFRSEHAGKRKSHESTVVDLANRRRRGL